MNAIAQDTPPQVIRNAKRTLTIEGVCSICNALIEAGSWAWRQQVDGANGVIPRSPMRCQGCGYDPALPLPSRIKGTKAEGAKSSPHATPRIVSPIEQTEARIERSEPTTPAVLPSEITTRLDDMCRDIVNLHGRDTALAQALSALAAEAVRISGEVATLRPINTVRCVTEAQTVEVKGAHKALADALECVACARMFGAPANVFLKGPAGTGKTTLAYQASVALALPFAFVSLSGGTSESKLTGNLRPKSDGSWAWFLPAFAQIFVQGGVFLLDEVDAADANVLTTINAALANGKIECDGVTYDRHPDCVIIAAANTFGHGADAIYVGRNQLDGATLDRFIGSTLEVGYDRDVETREAAIAGAQASAWLAWVWSVREKCDGNNGIRRVVGTRMVQAGARWLAFGKTFAQTQAKVLVGWTAEEKRKIGIVA